MPKKGIVSSKKSKKRIVRSKKVLDELDAFLLPARKISILSIGEQKMLYKSFVAGDLVARQKFILQLLRLCIKTANVELRKRRLSPREFLSDATNAGIVSFISELDRKRYDPSVSAPSTYFGDWIFQGVTRHLAKISTAHIPVNYPIIINKYDRVSKRFFLAHGRFPSVEEAASLINERVSTLENAFSARIAKQTISIDEVPFFEEKIANRLFSGIDLKREAIRLGLRKAIRSLNEQEKRVLLIRYGFATGEPLSLMATGRIFNISRERVRQVERSALVKLRDFFGLSVKPGKRLLYVSKNFNKRTKSKK